MPYAKLSAVNLYYEVHGEASAPPLVLLHGATDTFRTAWNKQIAVFSQKYYVIGLDMRGHGQSDNPSQRLDLRDMADDVAELLAYLGLALPKHVSVCGFSGGGSTALFFALRHTALLRKLVLVSNNLDRDQARIDGGFWNPTRMKAEQPGWWAHMSQFHKHTDPATLLGWWEAEDRQRPNFDAADLTTITCPVLVVGGDRDPVIPLDQTIKLYRALPRAQLAILPGIAHGAPTRGAALFNQVIFNFLT